MEPLNHTIALRVETGCLDPRDSKDGANLQPDQGGKLSSSIRGQESWDSKPRNPARDESSRTGLSLDGGERNSLQPSRGPVDHGEDVTEPLAGRQRSNQVQVYMRKLSPRDRDTRNRRFSGSKLCSVDNGGKTLTRGQYLRPNQATQTLKREVFLKHNFLDERSREERGTTDSRELQVPEVKEIWRKRHRERRIARKGWRQ